jgi:hypothetical protein
MSEQGMAAFSPCRASALRGPVIFPANVAGVYRADRPGADASASQTHAERIALPVTAIPDGVLR